MKKMIYSLLLLLVLSGNALWADDDFPPPWRLEEPGTVYAEFDYWQGFQPGGATTPPDVWNTYPGPLLAPEAQRINAGYVSGLSPRTAIVRINEPDGLIIKLYNYPEMNPEKVIRIQVTYLSEDPQSPQFPNSMFGFNVWMGWGINSGPHFFFDAGEHLIYSSVIKPGGWVTEAYEFTLMPNPQAETIGLKFKQYPAFVDQVVVDTWCKAPPVKDLDYGDAPDPTYPTLKINDGARHIIGGPWLGDATDAPDPEPDGQPSPMATGDNNDGNDDENGIKIPALMVGTAGQFIVTVNNTLGTGGYVDMWIDWNQDGNWAHPAEQVFSGYLPLGVHSIWLTPPAGSAGQTFLRARISSQGGLLPTGLADDGEVEDYLIEIEEEYVPPVADLGDAPDSTNSFGMTMTAYPTIIANFPTVYNAGSPPHGPIHWRPRDVAYLGQLVTLENEADMGSDEDPVNNINPVSNIADTDGADDGVAIPLHLPYCNYTAFDYVVTMAAMTVGQTMYVNVWFDWNRDGDWDDIIAPVCGEKSVPEWAVQNQVLNSLVPGTNFLRTPAFLCWHPLFSELPEEIWMRITLSETPWKPLSSGMILGDGGSGPGNGYLYGETEDYKFIPDTSCVRCADLNCDAMVDLLDFSIFASKWLSTCP